MKMNIARLKERLEFYKIEPHEYSLDGSLGTGNCKVIHKVGNYWEVFYCSERGDISDKKRFDSEEEACQYLWDWVMGNI